MRVLFFLLRLTFLALKQNRKKKTTEVFLLKQNIKTIYDYRFFHQTNE